MIEPSTTRRIKDRTGVIMPFDLELLAGRATTAAAIRPVILIDGRSGSGKTTLARRLAARLTDRDGLTIQLVSLDDCYPGWHGLAAASAAVAQTMLSSTNSGYRRYDWSAGRPAYWVPLDDRSPLIIEGCGAITPASATRATLRIWACDAESERRQGAAIRDGDVASWWCLWADQEQRHEDADHPDDLADVIVNPRQSIAWMPAQ